MTSAIAASRAFADFGAAGAASIAGPAACCAAGTWAGAGAACDGVDKTSSLIENITEERPQYMRPPFGDWNEELECEVGMTTVLWSVDSLDWKLRNKNRIVKRVLKDVEDGDIILMHDIFPSSVEAALELVDALTKEGYTFVTVDELLID